MMKKILFLLFLGLSACSTFKTDGWKTLDLGSFTIDVPEGSKVHPEKSIDSYTARIKGEGFELTFDYGAYSPDLTLSPNEYVEREEWRMDNSAFSGFLPSLHPNPTFKFVKKIDDSTFIATYDVKDCLKNDSCIIHRDRKYLERYLAIEDSTLVYQFKLPKEFKDFDYTVTDEDTIFKRVFIPKELNKHGAGVYLVNKNSCDEEYRFHCEEILSLWTSDTVRISKSDLERMLKSVKLK